MTWLSVDQPHRRERTRAGRLATAFGSENAIGTAPLVVRTVNQAHFSQKTPVVGFRIWPNCSFGTYSRSCSKWIRAVKSGTVHAFGSSGAPLRAPHLSGGLVNVPPQVSQ
jgi:hypothetical protein